MCRVTAGTEVRSVDSTKRHLAFSVKVLFEDGVPVWSCSWFRLCWILLDSVHRDLRLSVGRQGFGSEGWFQFSCPLLDLSRPGLLSFVCMCLLASECLSGFLFITGFKQFQYSVLLYSFLYIYQPWDLLKLLDLLIYIIIPQNGSLFCLFL